MKLPQNLLNQGVYTKPRLFLCQADKERICELNTSNTKGTFKFNSYSELSFEVGRVYNDIIDGTTKVNPYYDKIEALRLIYLENLGYFELQAPELTSDGIKEAKTCTAYSLEYTLSQKYLEEFYVNTGEVKSIEVINASSENDIVPVTLYNPNNPKLSLLHLILEKDYAGWKIGHVDPQLKTLSRQFEVDRESIYDFLINEVCEKFNCYIYFDTINNKINVYAESPTAKFIGDGATNTFKIGTSSNTFSEVKTVSINGYKTTRWGYSIVDGIGTLVLEDIPEAGAMVEIVGVDGTWETDVFVTFDNLSQEIKVDYSADDIKTVLTVTFGEDNDIREVNLGLPYIVDLSYYTTPEWMGQDLYDSWIVYQEKCNSKQAEYTKNSQDMLYYAGQINYEENRLSLGYAEITVNENSVGKYYVRGGTYPNYYYTEVSLPAEYNVNTTYYSTKTTNLEDGDTGNVAALYTALNMYFMYAEDWKTNLDALSEKFDFMGGNAITSLSTELSKVTDNRISNSSVETVLNDFFAIMWKEIGRTPLKQLYYEPYKKIQITNMEADWSKRENPEYGNYYTVILLLESIEAAISARDKIIQAHETEYNKLKDANAAISNELLIANNFTEAQRVRLNAFLREDELHLDDIVTTTQDSIADTYKNQQDALEAARIELSKISQPQLQFSMSMANIYALSEFEPIIDQFQLGNIIKVGLRPDYIKQSRLLQVDINFDDFSDFSVEFGELTSLRSQSDIHADLLKNAISAGKSVAQNASYWTKGSDQATSTDLKIQQGLLDATTEIKSIDGTQSVVIDKYGIKLQKIINPKTGEVDRHQTWLVNNKILMTDDNWRTSRAGLGQFTIDDVEFYGLIAEAVLSGYIEGSQIRGGTIQIGKQEDGTYAFEVHPDGSVTMNGGSTISGYAKEEDVYRQIQEVKKTTTIVSDSKPADAQDGQLWIDTSTYPYTIMVFSKEDKDESGEWVYFSQQNGSMVHTSLPTIYAVDDLWVVSDMDVNKYADTYPKLFAHLQSGTILKANATSNIFNETHWAEVISDITTTITNIRESFTWNDDGIRVAKRVTDSSGNVTNPFYVHIDSTRMGFHSVDYKSNGDINNDIEVVHVGNNSATIQNAAFEGNSGTTFNNNAKFKQEVSMYKPNSTSGFTWKVEANGSLSLVPIS